MGTKSDPVASAHRSADPTRTVIAYLRLSSQEQRKSGLGIEAQRLAVLRFCAQRGWVIRQEFVEVQSARTDHMRNRPQLVAAIAQARRTRGTLVVARLDRLSRSVLVTAQLMASGIDFVAADAPEASRLMLQLSSLMAEYESRLISERTKEGMIAARARGVSFARSSWSFTPEVRLKAARNAARSHRERAREAYADIASEAIALRDAGTNWTEISRYLNAQGHTTRTGGPWSIKTTQLLVRREFEVDREQRKLVLSSFRAIKGRRSQSRPVPDKTSHESNRTALESTYVSVVPPGNAITYCRVSTQKQTTGGYSLEAQATLIDRFCREHGLKIVASYVETERAGARGSINGRNSCRPSRTPGPPTRSS